MMNIAVKWEKPEHLVVAAVIWAINAMSQEDLA